MLSPLLPRCYTSGSGVDPFDPQRVPDSAAQSSDDLELRAHVENALSATYEVDQEIGRGGMGIVYRARDKRLKRFVAIKLLPPELSFRRDIRSRFLREAETAAGLSHPNIVPIYSVDEVGNLVFFVMACIDGDNLAKQLQKRGPLPVEDVRRWLMEVGDALAYAHSRGVIHRDIKPDNILIDAIDGRALVTDFGIARAATDSGDTPRLTATGMAIGTPAYMSPEQASGDRDLDARSDLYSLGIVAYQMLVGEPPFVGNTTPALLVKHLAEMPVPVDRRRHDVPPDLARIVMRLLEKSPDQRFQTANEMLQAMKSGVVPATPLPSGTSGQGAPIVFNGAPIGGMRMGDVGVAGSTSPNRGYQAQTPPAAGYSAPAYSSRTGVASSVPAPLVGGAGARALEAGTGYRPGMEERARWEAEIVKKYRKLLGPYLFVNGALVLVSIFGNSDFFGITTIWTVIMAWKYAKLWSDGYDWHDVLRQPKDRMFGEVISDVVDSIHATFSRKKREEMRALGQLDNSPLRGVLSPSAPTPGHGTKAARKQGKGANAVGVGAPPAPDDALGAYLPIVRQARADREEIGRLLDTIPAAERGRIPNVAPTAIELVNRIESMAVDLAATDNAVGPEKGQAIDAEIAALEAEANPLDTSKSETRIRRLAQLRRDRRAVVEIDRKREARRAQIESCRIALENMRLDLVRLRTGSSSVQSVTSIAEQAMALARDVDIAVGAAGEVRDATRPRTTSPA